MWNCCRNETKRIGHISISNGKSVRRQLNDKCYASTWWWWCFHNLSLFLCIPVCTPTSNAIRKVGDRIRAKRENNIALDVRRLGYDFEMHKITFSDSLSLTPSNFLLSQAKLHSKYFIPMDWIHWKWTGKCWMLPASLHYAFWLLFQSKLCNSTYKWHFILRFTLYSSNRCLGAHGRTIWFNINSCTPTVHHLNTQCNLLFLMNFYVVSMRIEKTLTCNPYQTKRLQPGNE